MKLRNIGPDGKIHKFIDNDVPTNRSYVLGGFKYSRNGRISKLWPRKPPGGLIKAANANPKGMRNPVFYNYLCRLDQCGQTDCVFCTLRDLAATYWKNTNEPQRNDAVKDLDRAIRLHPISYPNDGTRIHRYITQPQQQQDTHEFVQGLTTMLHSVEELNNNGVWSLAIPNLFNTKSETAWTCNDCGAVHGGHVEDFGITLPMQNRSDPRALTAYLGDYYGPEALSAVECDSAVCSKATNDRSRIRRIVQGPEVLVIQLGRFGWKPSGVAEKYSERVEYDEQLDLSPWTKDGAALDYQLKGVVAHRGETVAFGHYVAFVGCQNKTEYARVNDQRVTIWQDNAQFLNPGDEFVPYVLVYQKVGGRTANLLARRD